MLAPLGGRIARYYARINSNISLVAPCEVVIIYNNLFYRRHQDITWSHGLRIRLACSVIWEDVITGWKSSTRPI